MTRETSKDPVITLTGKIHGESAKAILFEYRTVGGTEVESKREWFPFSQTKRILRAVPADNADDQELDTLVVSEWICKQKEMI